MKTTLGGRLPPHLQPPDYPEALEREIILDGEPWFVRPIVPADGRRLGVEIAEADEETLYLRFFVPRPRFSVRDIEHLVTVDYRHRLALIAWHGDEPAAVARYEATDDDGVAEVAFVVKPEFRRRGLAKLLVQLLEAAAGDNGFHQLVAVYLPENSAAAAALAAAGFGPPRLVGGVMEVEKHLGR